MPETILVSDVVRILEDWAPKQYAYDWDNVGLQVGSLNKKVNRVMITLDVLENVVDEAIENEVNLIIAHHPLLFKAIKRINVDQPEGRILAKLLQHNITVYAAHTNLDITEGGISDMLADRLALSDREVLIPTKQVNLYKLIIYVPVAHLDTLREALAEQGAGHIGNYSHCTFQTQGKGSFKPLAGANPFIGQEGTIEFVEEVKLETIIKEDQMNQLLSVIKYVHPYEEPAFDLIPLVNQGEKIGVGRIGVLSETMSLERFCKFTKEKFSIPNLRVVGDLEKKVKKVAILGGSGEDFTVQAKRKGADVYVTGDMTFHDSQDANAMGLAVVDPGHHVEKVMIEDVKLYMEKKASEKGLNITFITSQQNTEPFQFL